jgi:hypothetical protein
VVGSSAAIWPVLPRGHSRGGQLREKGADRRVPAVSDGGTRVLTNWLHAWEWAGVGAELGRRRENDLR